MWKPSEVLTAQETAGYGKKSQLSDQHGPGREPQLWYLLYITLAATSVRLGTQSQSDSALIPLFRPDVMGKENKVCIIAFP